MIITEERSGKDVAYLLFANLLFDFLVPAFVFFALLPSFLLPSKSRAVKLRYEHLHLFLRILLKQDTALLSNVSQYVSVLVCHRRDISSFLDNLIV